MPGIMERGKGWWAVVGIVVLLAAASPFVKWTTVNFFDVLAVVMFVLMVGGYFVGEGGRHNSEQVDLMREGDHISRSQVGEVARLEGTPEGLPSRLGATFGGFSIWRFTLANRHLLNAPVSAVERFPVGDDHEDLLVYGISVPITAEQHYGYDSAMSEIAEYSSSNAFRTGEGSKSHARVSIFNGLIRDPTAAEVRAFHDKVTIDAKAIAEARRISQIHGQHVTQRLRKAAMATRAPSFWQRLWRGITGSRPTSYVSADKPTGDEEG